MVVRFDKKYLEELYYEGKSSDKKYRFQPQVVAKYIRRVMILEEAPSIEALYPFKSLNYEVLSGDKAGLSSVRIDRKYRLEFIVLEENKETVVTVCTLLEISNHYR